jgi:hypothetical protein
MHYPDGAATHPRRRESFELARGSFGLSGSDAAGSHRRSRRGRIHVASTLEQFLLQDSPSVLAVPEKAPFVFGIRVHTMRKSAAKVLADHRDGPDLSND